MSAAGEVPAFEVWRSVVEDDRYQVSSAGRVRNARTLHVLKPQACGRTSEYLKVNLGRGRQRLVHRLVCEAFHGPPELATDHADHLDFDPSNNAATNVRWLRAYLNIGRQLRWTPAGFVREADLEAPEDHTPLTDEERAEIEAQLAANGWQ